MSKPSDQHFVLHLRPEGPCTEAEGYRRLRGALKTLLRKEMLAEFDRLTEETT